MMNILKMNCVDMFRDVIYNRSNGLTWFVKKIK